MTPPYVKKESIIRHSRKLQSSEKSKSREDELEFVIQAIIKVER